VFSAAKKGRAVVITERWSMEKRRCENRRRVIFLSKAEKL